MKDVLVKTTGRVLLVGGGELDPVALEAEISRAARIVAADGGLAPLLALGVLPDIVIGDMDSVRPEDLSRLPAGRVVHVREQDSTDFEKCLRRIEADLLVCMGFLGARLDHALAALSVLVARTDTRCILTGPEDCLCLSPRRIALPLSAGTRVSLFPMSLSHGRSRGLVWPIDGIPLAPGVRVGTSNRAEGPVDLDWDAGAAVILILPLGERSLLEAALRDAAASHRPPREDGGTRG